MSDNGHGQTLHEYANYPSTERLQSRNRWKKKKANSISLTHIYMITHFPGLVQALLMAIVLLFMDSDYPFKLFCQLKVWKIRPKRQVVHILPWQHISTSEVIIILHLSINVLARFIYNTLLDNKTKCHSNQKFNIIEISIGISNGSLCPVSHVLSF